MTDPYIVAAVARIDEKTKGLAKSTHLLMEAAKEDREAIKSSMVRVNGKASETRDKARELDAKMEALEELLARIQKDRDSATASATALKKAVYTSVIAAIASVGVAALQLLSG